LKKSKKIAHVRGILLTPNLCNNNEFSIAFDPLGNLSGQGNIGASQRHMVSYGLPKAKIREVYLFCCWSDFKALKYSLRP